MIFFKHPLNFANMEIQEAGDKIRVVIVLNVFVQYMASIKVISNYLFSLVLRRYKNL